MMRITQELCLFISGFAFVLTLIGCEEDSTTTTDLEPTQSECVGGDTVAIGVDVSPTAGCLDAGGVRTYTFDSSASTDYTVLTVISDDGLLDVQMSVWRDPEFTDLAGSDLFIHPAQVYGDFTNNGVRLSDGVSQTYYIEVKFTGTIGERHFVVGVVSHDPIGVFGGDLSTYDAFANPAGVVTFGNYYTGTVDYTTTNYLSFTPTQDGWHTIKAVTPTEDIQWYIIELNTEFPSGFYTLCARNSTANVCFVDMLSGQTLYLRVWGLAFNFGTSDTYTLSLIGP